MKVLIIDTMGNSRVVTTEFIPRIGDTIDMFYEPLPTVIKVVAWPSNERLKALKIEGLDVCAIIAVG